jgi:peptidoglycan/LPS O-acetylase OafA/YrhL
MSKRFTLVDALRGIAALSVVLYHALGANHVAALAGIMPAWLYTIISNGKLGVAVFFVISGFVIAHSLRGGLTVADAGRFMLKRSIRLDPPYWFAIAIACSIAVVKGTEDFSAPQILAHFFYLQDLLGFQSISPVFWTLCLELQFYLVFAILLLTRSSAALGIAIALSLPLSVYQIHAGLFTSLWYGFLLGVAAYRAMPWFVAYAGALFLIGIYQQDAFMLVCVATAIWLFVASVYGTLTTWLNWRWLQFLGTISYSLYLIHNPVTGATFRIGYALTTRTPATEALWWLVSIATSIGAAWLVWLVIERPSVKLSKSLFQQHPQFRKKPDPVNAP